MQRINNITGPAARRIGSTKKPRKSTRADTKVHTRSAIRGSGETTRLAEAKLCSLKPSFEAYETKPTTSGIRGRENSHRGSIYTASLRFPGISHAPTVITAYLRHVPAMKIRCDPDL